MEEPNAKYREPAEIEEYSNYYSHSGQKITVVIKFLNSITYHALSQVSDILCGGISISWSD